MRVGARVAARVWPGVDIAVLLCPGLREPEIGGNDRELGTSVKVRELEISGNDRELGTSVKVREPGIGGNDRELGEALADMQTTQLLVLCSCMLASELIVYACVD